MVQSISSVKHGLDTVHKQIRGKDKDNNGCYSRDVCWGWDCRYRHLLWRFFLKAETLLFTSNSRLQPFDSWSNRQILFTTHWLWQYTPNGLNYRSVRQNTKKNTNYKHTSLVQATFSQNTIKINWVSLVTDFTFDIFLRWNLELVRIGLYLNSF